ncbi:MAG: polyphosphate polymerase domain-containing protein [Planctomycetales bacterium]|nr:polyphosphate polymerase domain-containing protein [Planctomycetales bacterium]
MGKKRELQSSRYELKYLIPEDLAVGVRRYILGFLEPDEYAAKSPNFRYPVRSVYLDSPSYTLYRQTQQGSKNRYKLRIRFYDELEDSPCFLEIKRREYDVIKKQRVAVTRRGAMLAADGYMVGAEHLLVSDAKRDKGVQGIMDFCTLRDHIEAIGKTYVAYDREAYTSPVGSQIRVTFDRNLQAARYRPGAGIHLPRNVMPTALRGVVLELKFTDRFPHWMHELVQVFNLQKQSVPKYVECKEATAEDGALWIEV